jgi:hypothetical protein
MTYDADDAARDAFYEEISRELYPEHKDQAIAEFTADKLRSYYVADSMVMRPAVDAIQEGNRLMAGQHPAAALVFFVTAIELLLKATLLKPVVHGLVLREGLADVVVDQLFGQTGFARYTKLLARLFEDISNVGLATVAREGATKALIVECSELQDVRNRIIHQGATCDSDAAALANVVAVGVFELIVQPMLAELGLTVREKGEIIVSPWKPYVSPTPGSA